MPLPGPQTICLLTGLALWIPSFSACSSPDSEAPQESAWEIHYRAGAGALEQGHYTEAESRFRAALKEAEGFAETDPRRHRTLSGLAHLYTTQGQHTRAESLYQRLLKLQENSLGTENPRLSPTLNQLAQTQAALNQSTQAQSLYRRILVLQEKDLDFQGLASTLNKLADLHRAREDYARADSLARRSMGLKFYARAYDYYLQRRYAPAEQFYKRALTVQEKTLGNSHPDQARTCHALALLYDVQRRYALAARFYKRTLAIQEKTLGENHPERIRTLDKLVEVLKKLERHDEAAELEARARQLRVGSAYQKNK